MYLAIAIIYLIFFCFFNVKLGRPILRVIFRKICPSTNAIRVTSAVAGFLALFPLRLIVPEHMPLIAVTYGIVGGMWCAIYYDYIVKQQDDD
jgi:hypothetical protein